MRSRPPSPSSTSVKWGEKGQSGSPWNRSSGVRVVSMNLHPSCRLCARTRIPGAQMRSKLRRSSQSVTALLKAVHSCLGGVQQVVVDVVAERSLGDLGAARTARWPRRAFDGMCSTSVGRVGVADEGVAGVELVLDAVEAGGDQRRRTRGRGCSRRRGCGTRPACPARGRPGAARRCGCRAPGDGGRRPRVGLVALVGVDVRGEGQRQLAASGRAGRRASSGTSALMPCAAVAGASAARRPSRPTGTSGCGRTSRLVHRGLGHEGERLARAGAAISLAPFL